MPRQARPYTQQRRPTERSTRGALAPAPLKPGVQLLSLNCASSYDNPLGNGTHWGTAEIYLTAGGAETHTSVAEQFISSHLAAALGLPIASGNLVTLPHDNQAHGNQRGWAVFLTTAVGSGTPPANPTEFAATFPHVAAGIQVFDTWIGCSGRTEATIAFAHDVGAWLLSTENCFNDDPAPGFLPAPDPRHPDVQHWCTHIRFLPSSTIIHILDTATALGLINTSTRTTYTAFLLRRRDTISSLVESYSCAASAQPQQPTLDFVGFCESTAG